MSYQLPVSVESELFEYLKAKIPGLPNRCVTRLVLTLCVGQPTTIDLTMLEVDPKKLTAAEDLPMVTRKFTLVPDEASGEPANKIPG
jgi:hypothetical protein